ncbi:SLC35C2 [Symbiodinium necroappetens]|uniref:SLC35C2 protein n=1 Tax=Symbiodinium necroappetens TaxID=1628268 RepID=A0A812LEE5_9DINO|nr:SLC35C2 [Symbiodinium necroappetens]
MRTHFFGRLACWMSADGFARWSLSWRWQMCGLVITWWSISAAVTVVMKQTVGRDGSYQFPFALTAMTNGVCGWMSVLACRSKRTKSARRNSLLRWLDIVKLVGLGVIQGIEIGMSNKSLEYLSVSTRTILSSLSVFFMMMSAQLWGLEHLDRLRICSACCQVLGGLLHAVGASHDSGEHPVGTQIRGMLLQLFTLMLASQRWVMLQFLMQKSKLQLCKIELAAFIMPVTSLVCFVLAAIFERDAFDWPLMREAGLPWTVASVACGIGILTVAELRLVHISSAVALQVLGTLHQIPLVITGVVWFQDPVDLQSALGFACCICGALCYARAKHLPLDRTDLNGKDSQTADRSLQLDE